jgi:hypothetical protein
MLEPLNVQKLNEMFRPNSPWDWALNAGRHGQYNTLVAVGYGTVPTTLQRVSPGEPGPEDQTIVVVHNYELEGLRENPQVRA